MDHARASELLGAYVLDSCTIDEADAVRLHIDACEPCTDELDRLNAVAGLLGSSDLEAPPPHLRQFILDGARAEGSEPTVR